jgi:hypothetical protein
LGIEDSMKEERRLLFWGFCHCFEAFCYWLSDGEAFLMWEVFGRGKNCWREKIAEGKTIAEGELLKGNC